MEYSDVRREYKGGGRSAEGEAMKNGEGRMESGERRAGTENENGKRRMEKNFKLPFADISARS